MATPSVSPSASPLATATVRSAMQLGLFHCLPEDDLGALARIMAERRIQRVVVGGLTREPADERSSWGLVSDLDLMRGLAAAGGPQVACDAARTDPVAVRPDDTLATAARLMVAHGTAHLLVASPQTGLPVGIVSTLDIARKAAA
jgi:CBS domain-containing protein